MNPKSGSDAAKPGAVGSREAAFRPVQVEDNEAPAIIGSRMSSQPKPSPESRDVEYLSWEEANLDEEVHTLVDFIEEDPRPRKDHPGPFIERCVGRNPETGNMRCVRIPAIQRMVEPWMVVKYRGSVAKDHLHAHSEVVVFNKSTYIFVFDRFYRHSAAKKVDRCCLVRDRIMQAGLIYERFTTKAKTASVRRKRLPGSDEPKFMILGAQEEDYRALRNLYQRHFLKHAEEEDLADDMGIKLIEGTV